MGFFPCERCQKPYSGKQQTMYPALLDGATDPRMRRRLCPSCFTAVHSWIELHLTIVRKGDEVPDDLDMDVIAAAPCFAEGCVADLTTSVFVTSYAKGQDREDWFGRSCAKHDQVARVALLGTQDQLGELVSAEAISHLGGG